MAKKVILQDSSNIQILPITRGEFVLDSQGNMALHSNEFLATDSQPGLTTLHYVEVSQENIVETSPVEVSLIQLKSSSEQVFPVTTTDAVVVNTDKGPDTLTNVLHEIRLDVTNSKLTLDERPTEGNTTHGVSSDGIYKELKETVGNIQILLQNL